MASHQSKSNLERKMWTADQVAEHFGVGVETVRCWIAWGRLAAVNIGTQERPLYRIKDADVEAFGEPVVPLEMPPARGRGRPGPGR